MLDESARAAMGLLAIGSTAAAPVDSGAVSGVAAPAPLPLAQSAASSELPSRKATNWPGTCSHKTCSKGSETPLMLSDF